MATKNGGFTMRCHHVVLLGLPFAALAVLCPAPAGAHEGVERELKAVRGELEALRRQVAEQGKMIRTLYEVADSEINFEANKKKVEAKRQARKEEDKKEERLLLQTVVEISDPNLTSLSCGSPVSPEIAVVTGDGGIRIYDTAGRLTQSLKRPGQVVTSISYSPDGKVLLAGTRAGALLVWEFSVGEWTVVAERVADSVRTVAWLAGTRRVVWGAYVDYHGEDGQIADQTESQQSNSR